MYTILLLIYIYIKKEVCSIYIWTLQVPVQPNFAQPPLSIQNVDLRSKLVNPLFEHYSKCPIQKVCACDCFLNNSRTKGDKYLRFLPFDTRDSEDIKVCSNFLGLFADQSDFSILKQSVLIGNHKKIVFQYVKHAI